MEGSTGGRQTHRSWRGGEGPTRLDLEPGQRASGELSEAGDTLITMTAPYFCDECDEFRCAAHQSAQAQSIPKGPYRRNPNPAVWKGEPGRIHVKDGCWDAEQHWDLWDDTELTPENRSLLCKNCDR